MTDIAELAELLHDLDGRGYKAYKRIQGAYRAGAVELHVDHVQGDPYAEPSRFRAVVDGDASGFPEWSWQTPVRRRATADFLNRRLADALEAASSRAGSGKSGELRTLRPGQEVLERTALAISAPGRVVARFRVGLPARGRRIKGPAAAKLVSDTLIGALGASLFYPALDRRALEEHVETVEDTVALRHQLPERGLIAFVAEGAHLPRRSGVDERPLPVERTVPFRPPDSLKVTLDTPNAGRVSGLGVPEGITLIVGGGYHGKSTLLRAIERGIYDHIPGDGRERVVALPATVKVRAEDGRRVAGTDISGFIGRLPGGEDTTRFTTENASGSTSQAAAIAEALEIGATALLLDEDTSATNFMIRDARMQRLIPAEHEPITPFIDRARQLHDLEGVSTVLVVGGSGDYFDVADTVIAMRDYVPSDRTKEAHAVGAELPTQRREEGGPWRPLHDRRPVPDSIDPRRGRRPVSIRVRSRDRVDFGTQTVDLGAVEQIAETAQTRAIANAVVWARGTVIDGERSMAAAIHEIMRRLEEEDSLDGIHPHGIGEMAAFRPFELAAFLNRLRTLETTWEEDG